MPSTRPILMFVPDLFFAAKIRTTATHLGVDVLHTDPSRLVADCRDRAPARVIVDLHAGAAVLEAVRELKADGALASVPVTGFYSHVDDATRQAALAAGVDQVMPRSAFTVKLTELLLG